MPDYSDYTSIVRSFNLTNSTSLPGTYVTPVTGIYTFSYNFLIDVNSLILTGNYDTSATGQDLNTDGIYSLEFDTFSALTTVQKNAAKIIMHEDGGFDYSYSAFFGDVTGIAFSADTPQNAAIVFGQAQWSDGNILTSDDDVVGGYTISVNPVDQAYFNSHFPFYDNSTSYEEGAHADVWLNSDFGAGWSSASAGSIQFYTIMHEIGHSMGLGHPVSEIDSLKYSIMSSNPAPGMLNGGSIVLPSGLQLFDIAALQEIYHSRDYATRSGNTTYDSTHGLSTSAFLYTIWDGGGTDEINASAYSDAVEIDLRQGHFSSIGVDAFGSPVKRDEAKSSGDPDPGNVAIAFHTVIENATGTNGADILIGNAWGNTLNGGNGADHLYGDGSSYDGDVGFLDDDYSNDPSDPNHSVPGSDDDTLNGGNGNDWLSGGAGDDALNGGSDDDTVDYARAAAGVTVNLSTQTSSNDGDGGTDTLSSIERVRGSSHNDTITLASFSRLYGSSGNDTVTAGSFAVFDYAAFQSKIDATIGASTTTIVKGASGADGTDTITTAGIHEYVGSAFNDEFAIARGGLFRGGDGHDYYTVDLSSAISGDVSLYNDAGLDTLELANFNISTMQLMFQANTGGAFNIYVYENTVAHPTVYNVKLLQLNGDADDIAAGLDIDVLKIGSEVISLRDMIPMIESLPPEPNGEHFLTVDSTTSSTSVQVFSGGVWALGTGGTGAGGGAMPTIGGGGAITSIGYSPTISSGDWVPYPYGTQTYHAPVITSLFISSGSMSMTTESYVKDINFSAGITLDDIRFTLSNYSSPGDQYLDIHVDSLGQTFTIPYFEAGKTIHGIGLYNTTLHSWIQGGSGNFSGGNGNMSGSFSGTGSPSYSSGTYDVTYFLQTISATGGSINMGGALTFKGTESGDDLCGLVARADTIIGLGGNDYLISYGGNDTLNGGTGDDQLYGGVGDDTYLFAVGDETDIIIEQDSEGTDTVRMNGYATTDVRLYTDGSGTLYIENKSDPADVIAIYAAVTGVGSFESTIGQRVEEIVFDDTTVWSLTGGLTLEGNSSGADIYGTQFDDDISGMAGNDYLYGNRGNDSLTGGTGSDQLYGGVGNDTYIFAAGDEADTLIEQDGEGADTVRLTGYATTDVRLYTDGSGTLYIENKSDPADVIAIYAAVTGVGSFESTVGERVEEIVFDDTTIWSLTGGLVLEGNSSGADLYGTQFDDDISGMAGNDYLYGNRGNDILTGGIGDDQLYGGLRNDTYIFSDGDGSDVVIEQAGEGTDTIRLSGYTTTDVRLYSDGSGTLFIENKSDPTDLIAIYAAVTGVGSFESTVGERVERIVFDDTTVWSLTGGLNLEGSSGSDSLYGTQYGDTLLGLDNVDYLYGNRGNDTLYGGNGDDQISGGDDNDLMEGGAGDDLISGDAGNDTVSYLNAVSAVTVNLATTSAQNTSGAGTDTITNTENLIGSAYNDTLTGDGSANVIEGGAGNDAINGAGGTDTVSYAGAGSAVTVNLATATAQNTVGAGTDTLTSMENLLASAYNDTITGSSGNNVIDGGAGNDTLDGSGGTDTVSYASANAAVTVSLALGSAQNTIGAGTDTLSNFENLTGSAFGDVLIGSTGNNTIAGGDGNDTVEGGAGNDTMTGGNGSDTVSFANAGSATTFNLATTSSQNTVSSGSDTVSGFENILGSAFNDTLTGNGSANVIEGGAGNDTIDGAGGTDTLTYANAGSAVTMNLATGTAQNTGGAGTDTISNFENLTGSAYNDTLTGNGSANVIEGGAGNDTIDGAGGTDTVTYVNAGSAVTVDLSNGSAQNTGGAGTDTLTSFENLTGSAYNDTLTGSTGNNTVLGGDGNDTIYGNSGTDTLKGGNGNDTLWGQAGTDTLYGEGGSDIFAFEVASAFSNQDTIADFSISDLDVLDISALLVGWNPTQSAIDEFVTFGTSGSDMTLSVDRDGTGGTYTAQAIATLSNISGLDADDLLAHGQLLAA